MWKTISVCFVAVALAVPPAELSIPNVLHQVTNEFLLTTGRAGRIELGTPVDDVYQMFGMGNVSLVAEFREGMFSPTLTVTLPDTTTKPALTLDIREWPCAEFSVWGISVQDGRFRTKDGFGVGSRAGDLRRAHPFQITDEEGMHAAVVNDLKMTFSLTRQGPVDDQRVTSVWIWPDPEAVRKKRCPGRLDIETKGWR